MYPKTKQSGFTLIELLVVIAIIGILTAIGIPMYSGYQAAAKQSATKQNLDSLKSYMAGEMTKCSAGLVTELPNKAAYGTVLCDGTQKLADYSGYFLKYTNTNFKNPYYPAKTPVASATPSSKAGDEGLLFLDSGDANCNGGLAVSTVIQDGSGATVPYPAAGAAICVSAN